MYLLLNTLQKGQTITLSVHAFLGLRQEYISMPAAAPLRRSPDMFASYLNTESDHADDFSPQNKTSAPSSTSKAAPTAVGFSSCKLPIPAVKQGFQSPKLTKLQQVTQFKLLRLAQNKGAHTNIHSCTCASHKISYGGIFINIYRAYCF